MSDTPSQSSPQLDNGEVRHTLSVHDVGAALVSAGVPRSHRQIIRYCETGMLDAVKVPGPTGPQWYVSPSSVPKAIGDLKQWEAQRAGQSSPKQDMSEHVVVERERITNSATASHGAPQPAMSEKETSQKGSETEPATASYVDQLEKRIEEKDDTIKFLQEELVDRRAQIGGMKAIIDGQRQLLESINNNVAPVFGALAQLVKGKSVNTESIRATVVDESTGS